MTTFAHMNTVVGTDVGEAVRLLRAGEIVAIPTETVYGLAANAFDEAAVFNVFDVKQRPAFDPLIVHVRDRAQLHWIVRGVPEEAEALIAKFWPGPLTLVLPKRTEVPDIVTSGLDTVGVRMPAHMLSQELLRALDFPLAAPSANPFGYVSPTTAMHVLEQLSGKIPYILDGGPCPVGVESTIVGWEDGVPVLYRPGGIPLESIEEVIGATRRAETHLRPIAPGMMASHYAPHKPLHVGDITHLLREHAGRQVAVISLSQDHGAAINEVLSPNGDLREAARSLFAALRRLDQGTAEVILAERFPDKGVGRAINDRLRRAAAHR